MIFVDTGPLYARYVPGDQHHIAARDGWDRLRQSRSELITTNHMIDESVTLLARRTSYAFAHQRGAVWLQSSDLRVESTRRDDGIEALRWFRKFADQSVIFTDAVSFAVMTRLGLTTAFTFDRHFELAGFETLAGER